MGRPRTTGRLLEICQIEHDDGGNTTESRQDILCNESRRVLVLHGCNADEAHVDGNLAAHDLDPSGVLDRGEL